MSSNPPGEEKVPFGLPEAYAINMKEQYDRYAAQTTLVLQQQQLQLAQLFQLSFQALQNAVTTADLVAKNSVNQANIANLQAIAHRDIAIATEWNVTASGAEASDTAAETGVVAEKQDSTVSPTIPGPSTSPVKQA
ncbi:MAG TPA: hypothetical protein VI756_32570 [Blastocatellia bacterium]